MFLRVNVVKHSLSLLLLYQINVILTICGCWLLQNLEKRKKSNKVNRLQIKVPKYKPLKKKNEMK